MTTHPFAALRPKAYALGQYVGTAAAVLLLISAPVQIVLAFSISGGFMFVVTALLSLLLILPLLLFLRATPPVTVSDRGIILTPVAGRATFVPWVAIRAVKPYPLLPPAESESLRRLAVGRRKYSGAEGIMLTSDMLPWPYRAVGWFAGEGMRGAVAITNRTHIDYARAKRHIERAVKDTSNVV